MIPGLKFKEVDVLDLSFRKRVIAEITGNENLERKAEHFRRYEVYNDRVAKYTEDLLSKYFDKSTVDEMKLSLSNLSLCRKVVDKLARVYSYGCVRELKSKRDSVKLLDLEKRLAFSSKMRKANRYLKLHNNIWVMCLPRANTDAMGEVLSYGLKINILPPFLFDVIEDPEDKERAKCLIISDYNPASKTVMYDSPERNGVRSARRGFNNVYQSGNNVDEIIADVPGDFDARKQEFIFWTDSFHLTCGISGEVISAPDNYLNPIGKIPGVALNKDQDGQYYSISGGDLVDSCLLINALLTNFNHIGLQQGYGQAYMIGKKLPQQLRLGPTKVVKMEITEDTEKAEFGFANSNAPMGELKDSVIMQIALLLSTNNLSTSGVKTDLAGGMEFPSGVAAMIDKAESTEDVKDQAQVFYDNELRLWQLCQSWISLYKTRDLLEEDFSDLEFSLDGFLLRINEPSVFMTEAEKLGNMKLRKELGINSMIDLILMDNPGMDISQAEKKLLEIIEEKSKEMLAGLGGDGEVSEDDLDDAEESDKDIKADSEEEA